MFRFCVSQQYVWTLSWQIHKERGREEGAINKEVLSMHRPILTSFYLIPAFVWNYLKAYSTLLNELLLKNTCSTIALEQLLKFSPSSFLRKGSCLVSALPGRFGTLIWTVRVTWTDWRSGESTKSVESIDFESCLMLSPHLSTIWTLSSASVQRLLATVEEKNEDVSFSKVSNILMSTLKTGMLVFMVIRKSVNLVRPSPCVTAPSTLISR